MARGIRSFSERRNGDTRVSAHSRPIELSLSALAREFDVSRETVRSKLARAGFMPVASPLQVVPQQFDALGQVDDTASTAAVVYRLRDAIKAFLADPADNDPQRMAPLQKKQHYQALHEQLRLQEAARELISCTEVELELARIFKLLVQACDTIPDILERDCGLTGDALTSVERAIDAVREQIYSDLIRAEEPADAGSDAPEPGT